LLPRSGLERSDFVLWHVCDMPTDLENVRWSGKTGSRRREAEATLLTLAV